MLNHLKTSLVQDMVKEGVIREEDAELYCFGFDSLKTYLFAVVITLGIGWIMGSFWESIVFLVSFKLLRTTAGGYHASNYSRCFFASCVTLVLSLEIIKYAEAVPVVLIIGLAVLDIVVVFLLAPLPDDNKPINEKERNYHRKRSRIVVLMQTIVIFASLYFEKRFAVTVLISGVVVTLLLFAWVFVRKLKFNMEFHSEKES